MVQLKLNGHEIFEQLCALATEVKINVQFLNLLTLRKIKIYQQMCNLSTSFDKENGTMEAGFHKSRQQR